LPKLARSAGVAFHDLSISGCNSSAIHLLPDPSVPSLHDYARAPLELRSITVSNNKGCALRMDKGTAAALHNVTVIGNGQGSESYGAIQANAGTILKATYSTFADNNGSAVNFAGVQMTAEHCRFENNLAANGAGLNAAFVAPPVSLYASEAAGTVVPIEGCIRLTNCTLVGNTARVGEGGALRVGSNMVAVLINSTVANNTAIADGGGASVSSGGCIQLNGTAVMQNTAVRGVGGGVCSRVPRCPHNNMLWINVTVANNTAYDGGGAYLSGFTSQGITIVNSSFAGNDARGQGQAGWGGALWIGAWYSQVMLNTVALTHNAAAVAGGALHVTVVGEGTRLTDGFAGGAQFQMLNCSIMNNRAISRNSHSAAPTFGGAINVAGSFASALIGATQLINNSANSGGALTFAIEYGALAVLNSQFESNRALSGDGGAANLGGTRGHFNFTDVVAVHNRAGRSGGAVACTARDGELFAVGALQNYGGTSTVFRHNHASR
jgi:hypothetical protein